MAARGLLANPVSSLLKSDEGTDLTCKTQALFAGYSSTPKHAVENFIRLTMDYSLIYPLL